MNKKLPVIIVAAVVVLLVVLGAIIWQKSSVKPTAKQNTTTSQSPTIKKVDLASQPGWVQKLVVTAVKGKSANSLDNVTIKATGIPKGLVQTIGYVLQYETTNKGTQGALSTTPLDFNGASEFTKTIDLGTCSTKSCVRHEGVTAIELELDFTTTSGDQNTWSKTIDLQ